LVYDEVGHRLGGFQPRAFSARVTGRARLANQAAGAQVCEGVKLIHRDETRDASAAHRHDDLGTALDVLDVAAEAVVQLADADLSLQRFAMWRHNDRLYALHRRPSRIRAESRIAGLERESV
jgi:hypothetical protein